MCIFSICGSLCVEVGRAGWIEENNKGGGVQRRGDCWDTVRGLEVACNYSTTTPPTRAMAYTSASRLSEVRGFVIYICVRGSVFNKQEDNTKWTACRQRCGRDHCDRFQSGIPYSTNEMSQRYRRKRNKGNGGRWMLEGYKWKRENINACRGGKRDAQESMPKKHSPP